MMPNNAGQPPVAQSDKSKIGLIVILCSLIVSLIAATVILIVLIVDASKNPLLGTYSLYSINSYEDQEPSPEQLEGYYDLEKNEYLIIFEEEGKGKIIYRSKPTTDGGSTSEMSQTFTWEDGKINGLTSSSDDGISYELSEDKQLICIKTEGGTYYYSYDQIMCFKRVDEKK